MEQKINNKRHKGKICKHILKIMFTIQKNKSANTDQRYANGNLLSVNFCYHTV